MTREELLAPILKAANATNASVFKDWDVVPGFIDGKHAATAVIRGTEIHFALVPEFQRKAIQRLRAQQFLQPLLERYGFLTTRVQRTAEREKKFVERIGFKPTWNDELFQYYLLGRLPFERK